MSTLYLGTDAERLAEKLAARLDQTAREGDFFAAATVVVPHRYLAQWLRLWLARRTGLAINLRFGYLESALWEMLRTVDPRQHPSPPELLDHDHYRLMVLSVLWDEGTELAPLRSYLRRASGTDFPSVLHGPHGRDFWRRSWHLADRLARFIRDYEYHRQDVLIQKWLKRELGYAGAAETTVTLEHSQRDVFERITRLPDGKRAVLERATGKVLKTLPQYAMEVMEVVGAEAAGGDKPRRAPVHLFGVTQISALHIQTLHWLGSQFDLRLYHLNPLVGRLHSSSPSISKETLQNLAQIYREFSHAEKKPWEPGQELLAAWGQAGAESLWLVAKLLAEPRAFAIEMIGSTEERKDGTVLQRLQDHVVKPLAPLTTHHSPLTTHQDASLQIVAGPGIYREVETVYNSILHNLQQNPDLKQTDIAVLVTDLDRYRPVLQAVFERPPKRLHYNLANFSAAGLSAFGQALLGFLDLALESFTRSRVFAILLNPCVLARLGVDRSQALTWLDWAEKLGIYHGWDRRDKAERGYSATPLYSWRLGLQRLRLGRIMDSAGDQGDAPAPRFQNVVPYADLASGDKEQLDDFCRAVEGLLPCLVRLRGFAGTGGQWAGEIHKLVQNFLAIPPDRPEEGQVRDRLLQALPQLGSLDLLRPASSPPLGLPLPLVREFVQENLEALEGTQGELLTGGVTISALSALRPIPFRVIYVLGLGEDLFPGANALPTFDLRAHERHAGDIRPAEQNRFLFLEALLAARDKLYLLYNHRELQRDQELHPGVPVTQLRRYLEDHVVDCKFEVTYVPLSGSDVNYLKVNKNHTDVLVNYNEAERLLALAEAQRNAGLELDARRREEVGRRVRQGCRVFEMPADSVRDVLTAPTISIGELRRFLLCPAEAALRRHLHLDDGKEREAEDEEPFWTDSLHEYHLVVQSLERFVVRAVRTSVAEALADWRPRFAAFYDDRRLRCQAPEGAFAEVDQSVLAEVIEERIAVLADFLHHRQSESFCGPILLGESLTPIDACRRFPALRLQFGPNLYLPAEVRLAGSVRLAWRTEQTVDILVLTNKSGGKIPDTDLSKPLLEPLLFLLALQAGSESGPDGSSQQWLENRTMQVHIAHAAGIARFTYRPRDFTPQLARDYLTALATDYLTPGFDLLPFELIVRNRDLKEAYTLANRDAVKLAQNYRRRLHEVVELDRENEDFSVLGTMPILELVEAKVPADAFVKVRQRFHLLDRGPARNRPVDGKGNRGKLRSPQARGR